MLACGVALSMHEMFVGDFDNYKQVVSERMRGVAATDDDGHEHIHCTLRRLRDAQALELVGVRRATLACYYLDAEPSRMFRVRTYSFSECADGLLMELFRPRDVDAAHEIVAELPSRDTDEVVPGLAELQWEPIAGCEIVWRCTPSSIWRGEMRHGECTIASQRDPSRVLTVRDTLDLARDRLLVNDRAIDHCGNLLYGSRNGVPYALDRVRLVADDGNVEEPYRRWGDPDLRWTLGDDFRPPGLLEAKFRTL
ncbi:hypothetical protein CTAYLR_006549 [Chrysophaeum taylorii]|uniref:Uncharacterized protein n=1 Tax=Chrysophaeum taylorii TaxID=2483200 RepID=A0AAD7UFJ0_9STRA|nr:hypothetical protein CTAYLR_006549 [Chrysophaeum taylorii]